jgi:hypothetical protein
MPRNIVVGLMLTLAGVAVAAQDAGPIWAKPDAFWYSKPVPGGRVWINVDAEHGVKEPLFDHQRLAIEMTIRTGEEYTPLTLPFADPALQFVVKYDGSNAYIQEGAMAIEFLLDGQLWRCDLQIKWDWNRVPPTDYECLRRRQATSTTPPAQAAATKRSPDGKWEAFVEQHNVAIRPAGGGAAKLLSTDGTSDMAYHGGSITWSADSTNVRAYRVSAAIWQSDSVTGNVKKQVQKSTWPVR